MTSRAAGEYRYEGLTFPEVNDAAAPGEAADQLLVLPRRRKGSAS